MERPAQLRRADRRLVSRVLNEHSVRNETQQNEIIDRIRSAALLSKDEALLTPMAMTAKLLASQIQQYQKTIDAFDAKIGEAMKAHPDAKLFSNLRGSGKAGLALAYCAFGSQRDRWRDGDELASFSGIAPVTRQSGKAPGQSPLCVPEIPTSDVSRIRRQPQMVSLEQGAYRMLRDRGMKHHAAIRKLARSWIRILYRVWQTRIPFDADRYLATLQRRCPEITPYLGK